MLRFIRAEVLRVVSHVGEGGNAHGVSLSLRTPVRHVGIQCEATGTPLENLLTLRPGAVLEARLSKIWQLGDGEPVEGRQLAWHPSWSLKPLRFELVANQEVGLFFSEQPETPPVGAVGRVEEIGQGTHIGLDIDASLPVRVAGYEVASFVATRGLRIGDRIGLGPASWRWHVRFPRREPSPGGLA